MREECIRGRFAPSPTGEMHLGNAWTALLAWLQVRSMNGVMVLRIEDLDPERCREVYSTALLDDLKWLGLDWDEGPDIGGSFGPYCQDQRRELYQEALERLNNMGLVYPCYCTRAELAASAPHAGEYDHIYPGTCRHGIKSPQPDRRPALRLAVPPERIHFIDGIYGTMSQHLSQEVGDFIVRRSDGIHAYQLAVVVDDGAMNITHVLRGDDLLSSTPRQLLLYRLLDLNAPVFTHVPLLYGEDGHRLSKRQRDVSIAALRRKGAKAENVVGYLAWKAGIIESFQPVSAHELIGHFNISGLPANPVVITSDAMVQLIG